jgi:hypothetical protein
MKKLIFILSIIAVVSGLTGSIVLYFNGLPSNIESETISFIATKQGPENKEETIINNQRIKRWAKAGIALIGGSFVFQAGVLIVSRIYET